MASSYELAFPVITGVFTNSPSLLLELGQDRCSLGSPTSIKALQRASVHLCISRANLFSHWFQGKPQAAPVQGLSHW